MGQHHKNYLTLNTQVDAASKRNHDKVIHQDLKEVEFDDIILGAVAPDSIRLHEAIVQHSIKLTEHTEYEITEFAEPLQVDQLLRVSFWDEVNKALAEGRVISERNIWMGVCSCSYWYKVRDMLEWKFAYILCPLMAYSKANKLGLHLGSKALLDILNASAVTTVNNSKVVNIKLAQLQIAAFNALQDRVYGKAVQRLQTHNTNDNSNNKDKETIEDLQREIAQLEHTKTKVFATNEVIPVEAVNE